MARIEVAATDADVVERLGILLRKTEGDEYSTTAALGLCTAIFAWVAQRVRQDEPVAKALMDRWKSEVSGAKPWCMPPIVAKDSVLDVLVRLRRSTCHATGDRVHPQNDPHCLTGFVMDANNEAPVPLKEWELRNFGLLIADQFVDHMRHAKEI